MKKRVVIIGLDGVPFEMIQHLTKKGVMPNLKDIISDGCLNKMSSSIPDNSAVSWSNMITGCNPGQHGIYGFTDFITNTYTIRFPTYNNLRCKAFWEWPQNMKSVILNVPFTYPVKPMNGIHVSGFISLDLKKTVYPSSFYPDLKNMGYQIDVDTNLFQESKTLFLRNLNHVLSQRKKLIMKTWDMINWDVYMIVLTGTDRINHMMWDEYKNSDKEFYDDFLDYYRQIDETIGLLHQKKNPEDQLILLSDHGMEQIQQQVYLNNILETYGFLKTDKDNRKNLNTLSTGSKAFCLEPSRIYINKDKKYPKGTVHLKDVTSVCNDLFDLFSQLTYKGKKIVKHIYRKDEIFHGPLTGFAPDMVLIPHHGFSFRGGFTQRAMFTPVDSIQGMHTQDNAFLIMKDGEYTLGSYPRIDQVVQLFKGTVI